MNSVLRASLLLWRHAMYDDISVSEMFGYLSTDVVYSLLPPRGRYCDRQCLLVN